MTLRERYLRMREIAKEQRRSQSNARWKELSEESRGHHREIRAAIKLVRGLPLWIGGGTLLVRDRAGFKTVDFLTGQPVDVA